jgi:hypothetical protein
MVQGPSSEAIEAIRNPSSIEEQISTLKQLKNDIVGHAQRKELVLKQGVVEPLVKTVSVAGKATGKRRESNGVPQHPLPWSLEDEARLQAILVLGSLASGGRAFVQPLLAAGTQRRLLESLGAEVPPRIVTASLQAIRSLATSAYSDGHCSENIHLNLFTHNTASAFPDLQTPGAIASANQQLKLATDIITVSATNESIRSKLADSGVLETLASVLASYAIAEKHFDYRGATSSFPPPPPATAVPSILKAITTILTGSHFRVQSFILCPPIRELFINSTPENGDRHPFSSQGSAESLLPSVYVPTSKSVSFNGTSSAWPVLRSLQVPGARSAEAGYLSQQTGDIDHANAVCGWIVFIAREMRGYSRLTALKLLALVNNAIEAGSELVNARSESIQRTKEREKQLALLAVPLAVSMINGVAEGPSKDDRPPLDERATQEVKEEACEVLAMLIKDNKEFQTAAVDAGAIKRVCQLLKKSFDNIQVSKPMWSAKINTSDSDVSDSCRMGKRDLPPEILHVMRCRKAALDALAALSKKEELHRKAIVDAGAVQCVIDSLKPLSSGMADIAPKDGNTIPVLLAACNAAQAMSRSVNLLRTSLIDAGVGRPLMVLVKHQELAVKIAATDAICNLSMDFSPLRNDLVAAGAVSTIVEHTRQSEMGLRLSSLWALKHLMLGGSKEMKVQCMDELGIGWLVGAIQGEQHAEPAIIGVTGGVSVGGLSTPNAAGEQVDILNPASMDVDDPPEDDDDDLEDEDEDEDGEVMYDEASSTHYQASQLRSTLRSGPASNRPSTPPLSTDRYLSSFREMEQDASLRAKRMDVAIQEQALDLIRNIITGDDCAVMLEHVLQQIGTEKFFSLLTDKLSPVPASLLPQAVSRNQQQNGSTPAIATIGNRIVYQPTPLILSTIHVIAHIANASPRHKSLLIAQSALLRAWLSHFTHPDRRVKVMCVWATSNLTWVEDESDRDDARRRTKELGNIGIVSAIRKLAGDADLDVRERVRTAAKNLETLGG